MNFASFLRLVRETATTGRTLGTQPQGRLQIAMTDSAAGSSGVQMQPGAASLNQSATFGGPGGMAGALGTSTLVPGASMVGAGGVPRHGGTAMISQHHGSTLPNEFQQSLLGTAQGFAQPSHVPGGNPVLDGTAAIASALGMAPLGGAALAQNVGGFGVGGGAETRVPMAAQAIMLLDSATGQWEPAWAQAQYIHSATQAVVAFDVVRDAPRVAIPHVPVERVRAVDAVLDGPDSGSTRAVPGTMPAGTGVYVVEAGRQVRWSAATVECVQPPGASTQGFLPFVTYNVVGKGGGRLLGLPYWLVAVDDGSGAPTVEQKELRQGMQVTAKYQGRSWYPGRLQRDNGDDTFDVRYDDGELEAAVPVRFIAGWHPHAGSRAVLPAAVASSVLAPGTRVRAPRPDGRAMEGVVVRVSDVDPATRAPGRLDIRFSDGFLEVGVAAHAVAVLPDGANGASVRESKQSGAPTGRQWLRKGSRVRGTARSNVAGRGGIVERVNRDGTYDVRFDGDTIAVQMDATEVEEDVSTAGLPVGCRVTARFRGGRRWFPGTVRAVAGDGSLTIAYDDGDVEAGVPAAFARRSDGAEGNSAGWVNEAADRGRFDTTSHGAIFPQARRLPSLSLGDRVEARTRLRFGQWTPGQVASVNNDATFDIRFTDGVIERGIAVSNIRRPNSVPNNQRDLGDSKNAAGAAPPPSSVDPFSRGTDARDRRLDHTLPVGTLVEAKFRGGSKWFSGRVVAANVDGSYHVRFDDGDEDVAVCSSDVRRQAEHRAPKQQQTDALMPRGTRVLARFKGGADWFKGVVEGDNSDGTYHVLFDDGDRDRHVPSGIDNIRPQRRSHQGDTKQSRDAGETKGLSRSKPRVGAQVKAKYKGGRQWFQGVVQRENRDGTFDVLFDDGDRDEAVPLDNINLAPMSSGERKTSQPIISSASLQRGAKVEAKFKNGKRWFKGEIQRENRDGTYEVLFDDGDRDLAVPRDNVKLITSRVQPASSDSKEASAGSGSGAQAASRPSRVSESSGSRFGVSRRPARPRPASRSRVGSSKPRTSLRDRVLARATSGSGAAQPTSSKPTRPTRPAASKK